MSFLVGPFREDSMFKKGSVNCLMCNHGGSSACMVLDPHVSFKFLLLSWNLQMRSNLLVMLIKSYYKIIIWISGTAANGKLQLSIGTGHGIWNPKSHSVCFSEYAFYYCDQDEYDCRTS